MAQVAPTPRMPAAFLGHGSPMNALASNVFTEGWRAFGAELPTPRAIVCVSAHWYTNYSAVTAMAQPRTIHDFFGFPQPLFDVQYPAPGDPELAGELIEQVKPTRVVRDVDSWGLDHGTWSVLRHVFPRADVPVLQLSLHAQRPFEAHMELGRKLAPLRDRGVLILGSGNVVHNLRQLNWHDEFGGFDWARRFDEAARQLLLHDPSALPKLLEHPDFARAVPTPEHLLPLAYLAGLALDAPRRPELLLEGYSFGALSMTSYVLRDT